jgi:hypothetical protein
MRESCIATTWVQLHVVTMLWQHYPDTIYLLSFQWFNLMLCLASTSAIMSFCCFTFPQSFSGVCSMPANCQAVEYKNLSVQDNSPSTTLAHASTNFQNTILNQDRTYIALVNISKITPFLFPPAASKSLPSCFVHTLLFD